MKSINCTVQKKYLKKNILVRNTLYNKLSATQCSAFPNLTFLKEEELRRLGCYNSKNIAISTQVYLDLCELKKYWNVEYFYNKDIDKVYFRASTTKKADPAVFIPVELSEMLSFCDLEKLLQLDKGKQLYMVIVSSDSTCVYYEISNGLVDPQQEKRDTSERSRKIDTELVKNRALIEQAALFNLPITLAKKESVPVASTSAKGD